MSQSRKVFVSYKYKDTDVYPVDGYYPGEDTGFMYTPRHYVDKIIESVGVDNIYKGEKSDDDASHLSDSSIASRLKDKLFDSSITVVLLSPNMWDKSKPQKEQWIPQEILYSLRTQSRNNSTGKKRISNTNGFLAIALPDLAGSYNYAVQHKECGVRSWSTGSFFNIIQDNMFNLKNDNKVPCADCYGDHHHGEDHSYIHPVRWHDFIDNHQFYIDYAAHLMDRKEEFDITKKHE